MRRNEVNEKVIR